MSMANAVFDPDKVLGTKITNMDKEELCEFVSALCRKVVSEVGSRGRRGGIFPENISVDENGGIALGPSGRSPLQGQELEFAAPELYWSGQLSAASDVYSVGMLMYYAFSGGKLPLEDECPDPHASRMGGGDFAAPKAAGAAIGEIIEKCIRFRSAERYQTLEELRAVLDSCVKNLYMSGIPSAESIFKKSDSELSEVERMMVGILSGNAMDEDEDDEDEEVSSEECLKVWAPPVKAESKEVFSSEQTDMLSQRFKTSSTPAAPKLSQSEEGELDPISPLRSVNAAPAVQYATRNTERERKIAEEVKKRRRRPLAVILVLCAVLVMVAIVMNAMLKDFQQASGMPDNQFENVNEVDPYAATMAPFAEDTGEFSGDVGQNREPVHIGPAVLETPAAQLPVTTPAVIDTNAVTEKSYQVIVSDVGWTEAQAKAREMGGYLVVIGSDEEFDKVVALAEEAGITRVWIGCQRISGIEVWEVENPGYDIPWGKGEPSYVDVNDKVSEDYVMLWNNNGWACNDNRDDPCKDYPGMYSGTMGYVVEFGN